MKKLLLSAFLICVCYVPAFAFIDTIVGGAAKTITATYDKAYQEFMKLQAIQQTRTLVQNYNESKQFYDWMKEISDYKGGVGAYIVDNMKSAIDKNNNNLYWQLNYDFMRTDPDDTAYVRKWVADTDKKIENKVDYSKEIHDINLKRDSNIKSNILAKAGNPDLKPEERDRIAFQASLTQLEIMNEMNKNMQQLLILENQRSAAEWAQERKASIEIEKMKDVFNKMSKRPANRTQDPYKILEELPK